MNVELLICRVGFQLRNQITMEEVVKYEATTNLVISFLP